MGRLQSGLLMILLCMSLAGVVRAEDQKSFAGTWIMRLGDRTIFVMRLADTKEGLTGTLERPAHMTGSNGAYSGFQPGVRRDVITHAAVKDSSLHLTIQNATDHADTTDFVMVLKGETASLSFEGLPPGIVVAPFTFIRADASAKLATDWEPNRIYTAADSDTPNAQMKTIYDEDQRVRSAAKINWTEVNRTDAERRAQVRKLLASHALHTGNDYEEASFVFQHGEATDDFLLAHTLALVAVSKGDAAAIWIAGATLDRYLQKVGQKQILGTQFVKSPEHGWTQEPYDRSLISDALREQLAVPTQSQQAEQLKQFQAQK